jgi:Hemerythrin HHE cation binding domain
VTSTDTHRDVVELLLEAHTEARQVVSLAESLAHQSCTSETRELAQHVSDFVEWMLPIHCADEDESVTSRLTGRNRVVDAALTQMHREHLALDAAMARLRLLCKMVARDVSRLHALRFELGSAAEDLRARLERHQTFEESAVIPALKRLLFADELTAIAGEMRARRQVLAA